MTNVWAPGAVTGIGSLPGTDAEDAAALLFGELPDLPHLAELPERGVGADMIGRTAALLRDLPVELVPSGWRIASHGGRDLRRAHDLMARDLDALDTQGEGWSGPFKVQAAGPWTLAANLELPNGHKVLTDPGAVRDLTASLAEGLGEHLAGVAARVPLAQPLLQLDEPSLPAVLDGRVPTPSGYGTVRSVERVLAEQALRDVVSAVGEGRRILHCCAADVPIELLRDCGADAISIDAATLTGADYDALGATVDAGVSLWLGVVPSTDAEINHERAHATLTRLWGELGFAPAELAGAVVATPACGLAGASPAYARRALAVLRDVGKALLDESG